MFEAIKKNRLLGLLAIALIGAFAATARADEGCGTYYQNACIQEYGESYVNENGDTCTFSTCQVSLKDGRVHVNCQYSCQIQ